MRRSVSRKSKLFGGYWGWFWNKNRLWLAMNEGGNDFAFNLILFCGCIPVGYYAAIRIWKDSWLRSHRNLILK